LEFSCICHIPALPVLFCWSSGFSCFVSLFSSCTQRPNIILSSHSGLQLSLSQHMLVGKNPVALNYKKLYTMYTAITETGNDHLLLWSFDYNTKPHWLNLILASEPHPRRSLCWLLQTLPTCLCTWSHEYQSSAQQWELWWKKKVASCSSSLFCSPSLCPQVSSNFAITLYQRALFGSRVFSGPKAPMTSPKGALIKSLLSLGSDNGFTIDPDTNCLAHFMPHW